MRNLRDRVFDLDEVLWIREKCAMASLFMYLMMHPDTYRNVAAHVVREGCVIDMGRFFWEGGRLVNPMGYAIIHDQQEVVIAMMQRGFSCTSRCSTVGPQDPYSFVDAVELAIASDRDASFLKRMLDTANLTAAQLTRYLRRLKSTEAGMAKILNEAIANARSQEPYYAAAWVWKDAQETKSEWRDVLRGHVMPVMRTLGSPPLYTDADEARLRGMKERTPREWEEEQNEGMRELHMRPNKLRKI